MLKRATRTALFVVGGTIGALESVGVVGVCGRWAGVSVSIVSAPVCEAIWLFDAMPHPAFALLAILAAAPALLSSALTFFVTGF